MRGVPRLLQSLEVAVDRATRLCSRGIMIARPQERRRPPGPVTRLSGKRSPPSTAPRVFRRETRGVERGSSLLRRTASSGPKKVHIVQPQPCNQAWLQALIHHGADIAADLRRGGRHGFSAHIKAAPHARRARPAAGNAADGVAARDLGAPAQARRHHGHGHRAVHESIVAARPPPLNPGPHAVDATPARRRGGTVSRTARTAALRREERTE